MFKFLLTIILLLLLPNLVQLKTYYYSSESECAVNCGVGFGAQCVLKSASEYSREFECICEHGIDGKNCKICASGYFGKNCAFQCPFGLWGENCANECNCSQPGSTTFLSCYPENGNCICKPGYLRQNGTASPIWEGKAQDCIFQCETGKWGRECQNNCDCQNDINCHHENGKCLCPPDEWTGTKCEKPCVKGTAKPGCKFPCDCIEGQGLCDELTGLCSCNSGFMRPRCEWPCPNGFWGPGCQQRCPNCRWCNPINGTCEIIPPEILNRYTTKFLIKNGNVSNESVERAVIENGFLDDVGDDEKAK